MYEGRNAIVENVANGGSPAICARTMDEGGRERSGSMNHIEREYRGRYIDASRSPAVLSLRKMLLKKRRTRRRSYVVILRSMDRELVKLLLDLGNGVKQHMDESGEDGYDITVRIIHIKSASPRMIK